MEREHYIQLRNNQHLDYLYDYYKLKFDEKKHSPFLGQEEFFHNIQRWPNFRGAIETASEYYDCYFNILKCQLEDKILYL